MKNSKREITLNEKDSIQDLLTAEKALLNDYVSAHFKIERKETRRFLCDCIAKVAEDVFFLRDVLSASQGN